MFRRCLGPGVTARMRLVAAAEKTCGVCGVGFRGRGGAVHCSARCRQRARRARVGGKCDGGGAVTVLAKGTDGPPASSGHCAEAVRVLAELDAELEENAEELGERLAWSAAERLLREAVADAVDRKVDLKHRWAASTQDAARVKLSAELRLTEGEIARLLRGIKTELPQPLSRRSQKAQQAARVRWDRA